MTVSPELFMAILSMDAYNRGYGAGINGLAEAGQIGDATIITRAEVGLTPAYYDTWQAAGFYAVAYDWNGHTVISYRGTDSLFQWDNLVPWSDAPGGDIWNSYALGAGSSPTAVCG